MRAEIEFLLGHPDLTRIDAHGRKHDMTDTHDAPSAAPLRVLVIGSLPPPIGGTTVSFATLVDELHSDRSVAIEVIDLSPSRCPRGFGAFGHFLARLRTMLAQCRRSDVVSLHICTSALPYLGLAVLLLASLAHVPLIIRKFGGTSYQSLPCIGRWLARFVLRKANLYLAQTQELVHQAHADGIPTTRWYPTSRPMPAETMVMKQPRKQCRRFVFLGQVRSPKGIYEIIDAAERFEDGVTVDIYGPLGFDILESAFTSLKNVRYLGVVPPDRVTQVLQDYDAFLLPTYHAGEGYPGALLEAYGAGLPIICTRWRALPEIVDTSTGILVEPQSADALHTAMRQLTEDDRLYAQLQEGVLKRRNEFSSHVWADRFVEYCRELITSPRARGQVMIRRG